MEEKNSFFNSKQVMFWVFTGILFFLTVNNILGIIGNGVLMLFSFFKLPYFLDFIVKIIFALFKILFWSFMVFFGINEVKLGNGPVKSMFFSTIIIFPVSYVLNYLLSTLLYIIPTYTGRLVSRMEGYKGSIMSYTVLNQFIYMASNFLTYIILIIGVLLLFYRLHGSGEK